MKKLRIWLRQRFCLHWFDAPTKQEYEEYGNVFVGIEQQSWSVTDEVRVCSRCGLSDRRRVGEPVYLGWS